MSNVFQILHAFKKILFDGHLTNKTHAKIADFRKTVDWNRISLCSSYVRGSGWGTKSEQINQ